RAQHLELLLARNRAVGQECARFCQECRVCRQVGQHLAQLQAARRRALRQTEGDRTEGCCRRELGQRLSQGQLVLGLGRAQRAAQGGSPAVFFTSEPRPTTDALAFVPVEQLPHPKGFGEARLDQARQRFGLCACSVGKRRIAGRELQQNGGRARCQLAQRQLAGRRSQRCAGRSKGRRVSGQA